MEATSYVCMWIIMISETLYENTSFPARTLAALVASKVYYHLEELDECLKYALGAEEQFHIDDSQYVQTILGTHTHSTVCVCVCVCVCMCYIYPMLCCCCMLCYSLIVF